MDDDGTVAEAMVMHDGETDLLYVDLFAATTVEELVDTVQTWAQQNPEAPWVQGTGWSMATFEGLLHKSQLDAVVPDRPVFLYSSDGHSAFVNSVALELAGITPDTPDPEDGQIERDSMGDPTGVLQEAAWELVADLVPPYPSERVDKGLELAMQEANQVGITTIVDASVRDWMLAGYRRAEAAGSLTLRVHGAVWIEPEMLGDLGQVEVLRSQYSSERVRVDSVKFFVDGLIESQTAVMLEPYTSGTNGTPIYSDEELLAAAIALDAMGFQLHAHVIGDGATRQFLDTVEAVIQANGSRDRRPQLAHLEVVDPDDWPRFSRLASGPTSSSSIAIHSRSPHTNCRTCRSRRPGSMASRCSSARRLSRPRRRRLVARTRLTGTRRGSSTRRRLVSSLRLSSQLT